MPRGVFKRVRDRFCPECGRGPFSAPGLTGHLNFFHGRAAQTPEVRRIGEEIRRWRELRAKLGEGGG